MIDLLPKINIMVIFLCVLASFLGERGQFGTAKILKYWCAALCVVLWSATIRINNSGMFAVGGATLVDGILSNISNIIILAMIQDNEGQRVNPFRFNGYSPLVWGSILGAPLLLYLIGSITRSQEFVAVIASIVVATLSGYVLVALGESLARTLLSLRKAICYWFFAYGLYQIGYGTIPLIGSIDLPYIDLSKYTRDELVGMYFGFSGVFKVAATFLLISASAETAKRHQIEAFFPDTVRWPLSCSTGNCVAKVLLMHSGLDDGVVKRLSVTFNESEVTMAQLDFRGAGMRAAERIAEDVFTGQFLFAVFVRQPRRAEMTILKMMLSQRKSCFVAIKPEVLVNHPFGRLPQEILSEYRTEEDLVMLAKSWLRRDVDPALFELLRRVAKPKNDEPITCANTAM
ncbi:MAG: hypothetical protein Q7W56_06660 [Candidatus Latescibacteria bacterium]|nr:hypothetical protein [Candidatus Latescibacterota bacterium]